MILFLYGPDTYRSGEKLKDIVARYQSLHKTGLGFKLLDFEESNFNDFKGVVATSSMFAEKKLIVVKGLCGSKEFISAFMEWRGREELKSSPETICVFYERVVGKGNDLFSWLLANSQSQEFAALSGAKLVNWLNRYIEKNKINIDNPALLKLVRSTGGDLWRLTNEIAKLKSYKQGGKIVAQDVDMLVKTSAQGSIFRLVDAVVADNKAGAITLLKDCILVQEDAFHVFYMLCGRVRSLAQSGRLNQTKIKKIYSKLVELDLAIKTGGASPREALEQFIFAA